MEACRQITSAGDPEWSDDVTTPSRGETYGNDRRHRLKGFKRGQVVGGTITAPNEIQDWTLDKVGNWSAFNNNGVNETRTHNETHGIATRSTQPAAPAYDANGNQTDDGRLFKFECDGNDNLRAVRNRLTNALIASYSYDAVGRRIMKDLHTGDDRVCYYYDGNRRLLDMEEDGDPVAYYTFGSYIDEPITVTRWLAGLPTYWYHADRLFSTRALTDSTGAIVERVSYDPYGKTTTYDASYLAPQSVSRVGNPFLFTGRELDSETKLYHYRARTDDPDEGRFKQPDPIGPADGWGWYEYVGSLPTNRIDPDGFDAIAVKVASGDVDHENYEYSLAGTAGRLKDLVAKVNLQLQKGNCVRMLTIIAHGHAVVISLRGKRRYAKTVNSRLWGIYQVSEIETDREKFAATRKADRGSDPSVFANITVSNATLAGDYLRKNICFCRDGCIIRLLSCNTGLGVIPQRIANATGCKVEAPTGWCALNNADPYVNAKVLPYYRRWNFEKVGLDGAGNDFRSFNPGDPDPIVDDRYLTISERDELEGYINAIREKK